MRGPPDPLEDVRAGTRSRLEATAARQEFLATVSRAFSEGESNPPALMHTVSEVVARHFGDTAAVTLRPSQGRGRRAPHGYTWPVFFDVDERASQGLLEIIASNRRVLEDDTLDAILVAARGVVLPAGALDEIPIFAQVPYRSWVDQFPVVSAMVAPLAAGRGRIIGAVVCTRRVPDNGPGQPFSEDDVSLLQEVADRAGISIENARLLAELNAANAETDLLFELTDAVNRAKSLDDVYAPALNAISEQLHLERCAFLLFDDDGVARFKAWRGVSDAYRQRVEGHSPWTQDQLDPPPILVADVREAPELAAFRTAFEAEGIRAVAFIPVVLGKRLLGKFMLYSEDVREFSLTEITLAQAIADQVASAVGQKLAQAERERLIAELTQTVRLNELFAGILGHDLRNPLGAILMSAAILARKQNDPSLARTVGRIVNAGQRMNRMISQLLDFTHIRTAGTLLPIQRTRVDLSIILRQAIDDLPESGAGARVRLDPVGDTAGCWDADRLAQAASNLVSNALRHGDAGGAVVVRIEGDDPARVTLSVRNDGTVPDGLLPVIWEPFQRGELRERRSGLGLGLFITREIAAAHGGTVSVWSTAGTTLFELSLPRGGPDQIAQIEKAV